MRIKFFNSFVAIACSAALLLNSCNRNRDFGFVDGVPGDGEANSGVTVDTSIKNVDASKFARARVFPGLACSSEPRLNNLTLNLNLNYFPADRDQLRISQPPIFFNSVGNPIGPLVSTGLYVGAGELLVVDVPAGLNSLLVQVGIWTYDASGNPNAQRDPLVYSRTSLSPGRNYIRNLYGGPVYIIPQTPINTPVPVTFTNVMRMPDFILGQTNEAEWQAEIRRSCVPWLELKSENMIFTVQREACIQTNTNGMNTIMNAWNDAIKYDYYQWMGLEDNPADPVDQSPKIPWRATIDNTLPPGAGGVSGYPFRALPNWITEWVNPAYLANSACWGTFHEIGHNAQQNQYWSWSSLGETTCNLFIFHNAKRIGSYPPKHTYPTDDLNSKMAPAIAWASTAPGTRNFDGADAAINDPFARITPFAQIFRKIPANWGYQGQPSGWDFMTFLYKRTRRAVRISTSDQQKRDFLFEAICDYTRTNWQPFFAQWGIAISANLANRMAAQYPIMRQRIWEYNPITQTGGDGSYYIPLTRTGWTITGSSEETSGEGATDGRLTTLLDGNLASYWHSRWNGTPAAPPHIITVDTKTIQAMAGLQIAQRPSGAGTSRPVKNVRIEISTDGDSWTQVGTGLYTLENIQGLQNLVFPSMVSTRYFRITIPTIDDVYGRDNFAALSEVNGIR